MKLITLISEIKRINKPIIIKSINPDWNDYRVVRIGNNTNIPSILSFYYNSFGGIILEFRSKSDYDVFKKALDENNIEISRSSRTSLFILIDADKVEII